MNMSLMRSQSQTGLPNSLPGDKHHLFPLAVQHCAKAGPETQVLSSGRTSRIWVGSTRKLKLL